MGSLSSDTLQIPVIDLKSSDAASKLLDAACNFGFVFIANNDEVSPEAVASVFDISKKFFALPDAMKQTVSIASNSAGKNHGWLSQGVEKLDPKVQKRADVKEAFNMPLPSAQGTFDQPLPDLLVQNLSTITAFELACHSLCQRILEQFAIALEIDREWFTSRHDRTKGPMGSVFRLLYYPRQTAQNDEIDIRAGAHSDYGSITCLFQLPGQPGLEIKTPGGEWSPVPVDPVGERGETSSSSTLPILVNIGDLLEDWTDGLLKSTVHRVVFPKVESGDRYSIAYFCHPLDEARLEPVPSRLVEEHSRNSGRTARTGGEGGIVLTARDHLMERLAATYQIK